MNTASEEMLSLVADDVRPLLLLRRRADRVEVEAVTAAATFGASRGESVEDAFARAGVPEVTEFVIDAVRATIAAGDAIRLDLSDAAFAALGVASLRFVPIGSDRAGKVDLVLVLGDVMSSARDPLTHLPGRDLLVDRWAIAAARARRRGGRLSVIFVDLDGFKTVNDLHGHGAGDVVLAEVAARLVAVVRAHDTVARYGGDEFVLLIDGDTDIGNAVARRILDVVREPVAVDGLAGPALARVGASVGLAGVDASDVGRNALDRAIAAADAQMYDAKASGGAQLRSA